MNDLWHIHDLPTDLLWWFLEQSWCLSQSSKGVLTILYAMRPDQTTWLIEEVGPPQRYWVTNDDSALPLQFRTHQFSVNHDTHELRYIYTMSLQPEEVPT